MRNKQKTSFLKYILFIFIFLFQHASWCNADRLDSILTIVQNGKADEKLALEAISLPYNKIVNNLNKCVYVYKTLNDLNIFSSNKLKKAELIEKLALVTYLKGNDEESFSLHKESIALFEQVKDFRQKANALATMGYESKRRNLGLAMDIMREAIVILNEYNYKGDLATAYDNYGVLFEMKGKLDSATHYYTKALRIKEQNQDSTSIPYSLNNLAGVCFMKKNMNEGLAYINKSNEIRKNIKDYLGICWNEFTLGEMYIGINEYAFAEKFVRTSLNLAKEYSYPELIARNTKYLAMIFAHKRQYDSAYIAFNRFYALNDSLHNIQKQNQILEMETVYETEKKSFRIKALNDENSIKEAEIEKKKNTVYFLIIIVVFFGAGGILIARAYQQKNKANKIITLQKKETEKQKEIVQEKQKEILDSIRYAKRIQQSLMPTEKYIERNVNKLKDKK